MENTHYHLYVNSTSYTVYPGKEALGPLSQLIARLEFEDEFEDDVISLGYMLDEDNNYLYLHRGIKLDYLRKLLKNVNVEFVPPNVAVSMNQHHDELIAPRSKEQVDVINFIAGLDEHATNVDDQQLFLVKKGGFGKAEPYSRKIPTPTPAGYTLMQDLKIGDYVFTQDGSKTVVVDIFEQGMIDIYRVTFDDGRVAYCGKEHLWYVKCGNEPFQVMRLEDMLKQPKAYNIPVCGCIDYPYTPLPCDLSIIINSIKDRTLDCIPTPFLVNDIEHRFKLLEALQDYLKTEQTIQEQVIEQLMWLYRSLGYIPIDKGDAITLSNHHYLTITNIEYSHSENARCIKVSNPKHLYVTEDFIVTHNTYCSGRAACIYNQKTLIVMHRDTLRTQWRSSLYDMQGLDEDDVYEITSSEELFNIANGWDPGRDIYLMTHATFRAGVKRIREFNKVANIPKVLGIGLKIIDEAHLEFRDTLMMDFAFNINRNLYLTATAGRSSKNENTIFNYVFSNAKFYKPSSLLTMEKDRKWVKYKIVEVNTNADPRIVKYRVEGYRGKMSPASYGKWVIQYDKKQTHIKCVCDIVREIYERDPTSKVLIFMPLIDLCVDTSYYLSKHLNYDESFAYDLNIQTINSKNSKMENNENKHADVIITTVGSCGTGTDIPGVTAIVSCSPFVSTLTAKQVTWRLRYCGKTCYYYDIYDSSVKMDKIWLRSRMKTISAMAMDTEYLSWTLDDDNDKSNDK